MAMIDIKDLKKSFGSNHVLNGVNLSVDKGDIVAIIGSSGSGKSTLVRCIAGLEKPDTGQILLNGEEYLDDGKGVGKIGMVFQNFNLFPHYTARENITKPLTLSGLSEHFDVSKSYLLRLFRRDCHTSVTTYINNAKLDLAAELLCSSMMNVSEVAYHLGYSDTGYFSRIFRKRF